MEFQPAEFADVPYGTIARAPCSPRVTDPRFQGIVIRMPEEVRASQGEKIRLPICGYYQLPTGPLVMGADIHIHVRGLGPNPLPPLTGKVVTDMCENEPEAPIHMRARRSIPISTRGRFPRPISISMPSATFRTRCRRAPTRSASPTGATSRTWRASQSPVV